MKTFPILATLAATVAFVVYQFSFQVSVSLLFAAGLIGIAIADYRRTTRPLVANRVRVVSRAQRLRLAA